MLLEEDFNSIIEFNDPEEALNYLINNHSIIDFIICNINMPKFKGVELFFKFRLIDNETPFVFYSGHVKFDAEIKKLSKKYRLDKIVNKPNLNIIDLIKDFFIKL